MQPTLGLTGLTVNGMALIAPGAFLWLTYSEQAAYGAPTAGSAMWFGFLMALALCYATAVCYSELSKLYPGAGSSYLFAEQAFLSKSKSFKWARLVKFFTGWNSHLYYWVYPGVMVGVTAILAGYLSGYLFPDTFSSTYNSPVLMYLFCVVFAIVVSWIAFRGVNGSTVVNIVGNVIQITALVVFSIIAISYRMHHPEGAAGWHLSNGTAIQYQVAQTNAMDNSNPPQPIPDTWADNSPKFAVGPDGKLLKDKDGKPVPAIKQVDQAVVADDLDPAKNKDKAILGGLKAMGLDVGAPYPVWLTKNDASGNPLKDKDGNPILDLDKDGNAQPAPFTVSYTVDGGAISGIGTKNPTPGFNADGSPPTAAQDPVTNNYHDSAADTIVPHGMISPHGFSWIIVQAGIAILCLCGFESITSLGEEAKNPKKHIPWAVLIALTIQGGFCYLFEYFASNYFLNSGYTLPTAGGSPAPIGDMMVITGSWLFGSFSAGRAFMLIEAATVFLALIGTTLACLNTGARITYAMGRDEEVSTGFGVLHGKNLTPHRAIWVLCFLSIIIGWITVTTSIAVYGQTPAPLDKHNFWYSFGVFSNPSVYSWIPNTFLTMSLVSTFGMNLLYMTTCIVTIVAFNEHHMFSGFKHMVIPVLGALANFLVLLFYLLGPKFIAGMSPHEPYIALAAAAIWAIFGGVYLMMRSKKHEKPIFVEAPSKA